MGVLDSMIMSLGAYFPQRGGSVYFGYFTVSLSPGILGG